MALIAGAVRLLHATYRVRVVDPSGFLARADRPAAVLAIWHNRLIFAPLFFPRPFLRKVKALASLSRDGAYAAQFMAHFLGGMVRGSSSRGGTEALRAMKRELSAGWMIALTVDGPRGPRYRVHVGAILLAEMTGVPIVPVVTNARRRWELRGWDRTQIPKPFARVELVIGEPLEIRGRLTPEERDQACETLRQRLEALTRD